MLGLYATDIFDKIAYDIGATNVYIGWSVYLIIAIGLVNGMLEIVNIISLAKERTE